MEMPGSNNTLKPDVTLHIPSNQYNQHHFSYDATQQQQLKQRCKIRYRNQISFVEIKRLYRKLSDLTVGLPHVYDWFGVYLTTLFRLRYIAENEW
jgi:hypothetical protein